MRAAPSCKSAQGPDADRRHKFLIKLGNEGSRAHACSHGAVYGGTGQGQTLSRLPDQSSALARFMDGTMAPGSRSGAGARIRPTCLHHPRHQLCKTSHGSSLTGGSYPRWRYMATVTVHWYPPASRTLISSSMPSGRLTRHTPRMFPGILRPLRHFTTGPRAATTVPASS